MAAINVARVRAVKKLLPVARKPSLLDHSFAGREFSRRSRAARERHRVIANPLLRLGGKDHVFARPLQIADCIELIIVRCAVPELAALSRLGVSDLKRERVTAFERGACQAGDARRLRLSAFAGFIFALSCAGRSAGEALPACALCAGCDLNAEGRAGAANEGDAFAVGRPRRVAVVVYAGREIGDFLFRHVINADEGMIVAIADEGELRAVGRPARIAVRAVSHEERFLAFVSRG